MMRSSARRAWGGLATIVLWLGIPGPALAGPEETKKLDTLVASEAHFTRALAAHRRGDLDAAAEAYREALERDPEFVEAMANLARVEVGRDDLDEAAEWIDRAEVIRIDYPGVHAARGLLALRLGDAGHAVDALEQARALMPNDVEVLVNLGAALLARGFHREAIAVSREAQALDLRHPAASFNLGLAHDHAGEPQSADYHYRRFLDLTHRDDPDRARVEERLAELANLGEPHREDSLHLDSRVGPAAAAPGGSHDE